MSEISRSAPSASSRRCHKAIESATVFCKLRGNPYVELVHWFHQILNAPDSDLHRIVRHFELDASRLAKDLADALDRFRAVRRRFPICRRTSRTPSSALGSTLVCSTANRASAPATSSSAC